MLYVFLKSNHKSPQFNPRNSNVSSVLAALFLLGLTAMRSSRPKRSMESHNMLHGME